MTENKRLNYADMAKSIAILIIVFYHLAAPGIISTICTHMAPSVLAIFFFFSGYFYRSGKRSLIENVKLRAAALIIPFFKYSLIFWLIGTVYLVVTKTAPFIETLCCLRNFFGGCIWNRTIQAWFYWEYYSLGKRYIFLADFWFLPALFFASLLFFPIADKTLHSKTKTFTAIIILFAVTGIMRSCGVSLPYNFQLVPFWAAFLLLGAFAGCNGLFEIKNLSVKTEWLAAIAALSCGIIISMQIEPSVNVFRGFFAASHNEAVSMLLYLISSILVIWGLGEICKLAESASARISELAWLGSHTMTIYIYHMFIAWLLSIITGCALHSLLLSCAVLIICAAIAIVTDRITNRS